MIRADAMQNHEEGLLLAELTALQQDGPDPKLPVACDAGHHQTRACSIALCRVVQVYRLQFPRDSGCCIELPLLRDGDSRPAFRLAVAS